MGVGDCVNGVRQLFKEFLAIGPRFLPLVGTLGLIALAFVLALGLLFLVHQLVIWSFQDPVYAFETSRSILNGVGIGWDTGKVILFDPLREVGFLVIPAWNAVSMYAVQPVIYSAAGILSLAFTGRPYEGVLSQSDLPYEGFRCDTDPDAAKWCGMAGTYSEQMGVATEDNKFVANGSLVINSETARRLSERTGDALIGSIDLSFLLDSMEVLISSFITIGAHVSDIAFHVLFTLLSALFKILFEAFLRLVRSLGAALMAIINSGEFKTILNTGIEVFSILLIQILVPGLMALVQLFFCLMSLFNVSGYQAEFECIEDKCWLPGNDAFMDTFHVFSSIPAITGVVEDVVSALINHITGIRYGDQSAEAAEAPSFRMGLGSEASEQCAACFSCKVRRPFKLRASPPPAFSAQPLSLPSRTGAGSALALAGHCPQRLVHQDGRGD